MNKIINLNGNAVELAKIKSISVNEYPHNKTSPGLNDFPRINEKKQFIFIFC